MMDDKVLSTVIEHAMEHYVTRTTERQGSSQVVRSSMNLPQRRVQDFLLYLVGQGKTPDEAVNLIRSAQQNALKSGSSTGNKWAAMAAPALIIVLLLLCIALRDMPLWPLLIAIPLVTGLMWLIWNPRDQVMNDVWQKNRMGQADSILDELPKLQEVAQMPFGELLRKHVLVQALALTLVPALVFVGIAGYMITDSLTSKAYHEAMTANGDLLYVSGSTGDLYTVYDVDEKRYVKAYLAPEMIAERPEDVRGVLIVDMNTVRVGTYGNDMSAGAYQYVADIELYDCERGVTLMRSERVLGSNPPSTVRSNRFTGPHNAYGLKPSDSEIRTACEKLIRLIED